MLRRCRLAGLLLFLDCVFLAAPAWAQSVTPESAEFFEKRVRPVLVENCFKCHGSAKQKGSLRLDSLAGMLTGGDQGPVIVTGQPEKSLLIKAIGHEDADLKMPPSKILPAQQVADLTRWVKMGAPWPGRKR